MAVRKSSPSFRRLEGKVDGLAQDVKEDREATTQLKSDVKELGRQVGLLNPNGKATAILALADASGPLLELARVAPRLVEAVEERREREIVSRWLKRTLNPFASKLGALVWLLVSAAVFAYIANLVSAAQSHH